MYVCIYKKNMLIFLAISNFTFFNFLEFILIGVYQVIKINKE